MFDSSRIVVGLDLGTSKVCAVVVEITDAGALNVIGLGQAKSRGVRKGEIVNVEDTMQDIRDALAAAEEMSDREIQSVYLGVTGGHVRSFNNRGFHPVASVDREIMADDVQDVLKNARALNLPGENKVLHLIRQQFLVDGESTQAQPIGRFGARLEVDFHVIHGSLNRLQTPIRAVKSLQIEVEDVVFSGLGSALSCLNNHQKSLGTIVIDMGAGSTEYLLYSGGVPRHSGVIAVGGDHISNDLAYGLKVPLGRAEQLKLDHGGAVVEAEIRGHTIALSNDHGLPDRTINLEHLRRIMGLRLEEVFQLILQDLDRAGVLHEARGVVLTGGGSRVPNVEKLAAQVFEMPVSRGRTTWISGDKSQLDQPEFATAFGLVRFASFEVKKRTASNQGFASRISGKLANLLRMN